jgi:hypothetical protein
MNTKRKAQVATRVKHDSHETLLRLAAAHSCTLGYYVEQVLEEHVIRQRHPDTGGGVMHEIVVEMDERFAAHVQHLQNTGARELSTAVTRLEGQLDALKVMVDAIVRTLSPRDHEAYVNLVKATLQKLGPLFENGNRKSA